MQYSNVVGVAFTTPKVYSYSNVLELSFETTLGFGIVEADVLITPGQPYVLQVAGITDEYFVRWSPTPDPVHPSAVALTVVSGALDGSGNGTVTVAAARGSLRYGQTGHVILVMGAEQSDVEAMLSAEPGLKWVNLTSVVPQWTTGVSVVAGAQVWNPNAGPVGSLYQAATSGTTGATIPAHADGTMSDGGVDWAYVSAYTRLVASPDLTAGNQVAVYDVQGGTVDDVQGGTVDDVTLNLDATWDQAAGITSKTVIAHGGAAWGVADVQTIEDWPVEPPPPPPADLVGLLQIWTGSSWFNVNDGTFQVWTGSEWVLL